MIASKYAKNKCDPIIKSTSSNLFRSTALVCELVRIFLRYNEIESGIVRDNYINVRCVNLFGECSVPWYVCIYMFAT